MSRAKPWEFAYRPVTPTMDVEQGAPCDVVVATREAVGDQEILAAIEERLPDARVDTLLEAPPLFWSRICSPRVVHRDEIEACLRAAKIPLRYVASASRGSVALAPPLELTAAHRARPSTWRRRSVTSVSASASDEPETRGRWFLQGEAGGVAVDRNLFGRAHGRRLAVIDDDALDASRCELDAEVLVGLDVAPRSQAHGALMVAWAVGCRGFHGVAPDASPRLYLIPKPSKGVVWLPLAIIRATLDGADVILCATYVEGMTSPMLDDALELATRMGRRGLGSAVILPTGREASSPSGSLRPSFSLDLAAVAADPRVFCVAPGAREGGWFYFLDRRGRARPFANRGPSVRWLAPGDDIADPFAAAERLTHAESSGASAIAAGIALLVLSANPSLRLAELDAILSLTVTPVDPAPPLAIASRIDPADALPLGRDRDGHNAKHGYGCLHSSRACLAAVDPMAFSLVAIGEDSPARRWIVLRRTIPSLRRLYSKELAQWMVRALLADVSSAHAFKVIVRHMRLVAGRPEHSHEHSRGAIVRQIVLIVRRWANSPQPRASKRLVSELRRLERIFKAVFSRPKWLEQTERGILEWSRSLFVLKNGAHWPVVE